MKVELTVGFTKIVSGDLPDAFQPIAQGVAVDVEDSSRALVVANRFEVGAEGRDEFRVPAVVIVKKSSEPVPPEPLDGIGVLSLGQDLKYTEIVEEGDGCPAIAI